MKVLPYFFTVQAWQGNVEGGGGLIFVYRTIESGKRQVLSIPSTPLNPLNIKEDVESVVTSHFTDLSGGLVFETAHHNGDQPQAGSIFIQKGQGYLCFTFTAVDPTPLARHSQPFWLTASVRQLDQEHHLKIEPWLVYPRETFKGYILNTWWPVVYLWALCPDVYKAWMTIPT